MTDQEAFEAWYSEYLSNNTEYPRNQDIWHAALTYLRSQQEPTGWLSTLSFDGVVADRKVTLLEPRYPFGVPGADFRREGSRVDWYPLYLTPQPAIPDGWKLVPVEPTGEMWSAGRGMFITRATLFEMCHTSHEAVAIGDYAPNDIYRAMLAAAPEYKK